jgi:hypothetical protein
MLEVDDSFCIVYDPMEILDIRNVEQVLMIILHMSHW